MIYIMSYYIVFTLNSIKHSESACLYCMIYVQKYLLIDTEMRYTVSQKMTLMMVIYYPHLS